MAGYLAAQLRLFSPMTFTRSQTWPLCTDIPPFYAAAFGAGVIAGTWNPSHGLLTTGGVGALTQVGFGILANVFGDFLAGDSGHLEA